MKHFKSEYSGLSMRILEEIKKEYPAATFSQVRQILDETCDWASELVLTWERSQSES